MSARTVLLHVGVPKTGTSFVQDLLFQNRERLAEQGVLYPADRFDAHFLAALDLMQLPWGDLEKQAIGRWEQLAEQVRAWTGTVIISHEILAAAQPQHVVRALASFGEDTEVHVVVSARDLARQLPAEWQENVKHRRVLGYRAFLDAVTAAQPTGPVATWFWSVQDIPSILDRWATGLPPERVHLVTVPKRGAPRDLLWQRFASAFRLDPDAFDTSTVERDNPSMGVAETALVRRLNQRLNGVLPNEQYREFVRELLAHRTLSRRPDAVRLRLPDDVRAWAAELSEAWVALLREREYDVVGTLDDLAVEPADPSPWLDPDAPLIAEVGDAAIHGLASTVLKAGELRAEVDDLRHRLEEAIAERDQARREAGIVIRAKRAVVARQDTNRIANLGLRAVRKTRAARNRAT